MVISIIFFTLLIGACSAMLMETLGDEIRTIVQRAVDRFHGHEDPIEQMRSLKEQVSSTKRI
ncbi:MAG: hypothetical protein K2W95_12065 [Candidatus Obscuribacterales bacterium]|nr:hypothetical protein [Candidatus Obscuribacterales bacterium]